MLFVYIVLRRYSTVVLVLGASSLVYIVRGCERVRVVGALFSFVLCFFEFFYVDAVPGQSTSAGTCRCGARPERRHVNVCGIRIV